MVEVSWNSNVPTKIIKFYSNHLWGLHIAMQWHSGYIFLLTCYLFSLTNIVVLNKNTNVGSNGQTHPPIVVKLIGMKVHCTKVKLQIHKDIFIDFHFISKWLTMKFTFFSFKNIWTWIFWAEKNHVYLSVVIWYLLFCIYFYKYNVCSLKKLLSLYFVPLFWENHLLKMSQNIYPHCRYNILKRIQL